MLRTTQLPTSWNEDTRTARVIISSEGFKSDGFDWVHGLDAIIPPAAPVPLLIDNGSGHSGDVGTGLGSLDNFSIEPIDGVPSLLADVHLDGIDANVEKALPAFRNGSIRFSAAPAPERAEETSDGIRLMRWGVRHVVATMMPVDVTATMRTLNNEPTAMGAKSPDQEPKDQNAPPVVSDQTAPPRAAAPAPALAAPDQGADQIAKLQEEKEILKACMVAGRVMGADFDPEATAEGFMARSLSSKDAVMELFKMQAKNQQPAGGPPVAPAARGIEVQQEQFGRTAQGITAALAQRLGKYDRALHGDIPPQLRGARVDSLCRSWLEAAGVPTGNMTAHECIDLAMTPNGRGAGLGAGYRDNLGRAFHTTDSLPGITSNLANKTGLDLWEQRPPTWMPFAERIDLNDFKPATSVYIDGKLKPASVKEAGEYQLMTVSDGTGSYRLLTYRGKIMWTREMQINDDLDMLSRMPRLLSDGIFGLFSDLVYGLITGYDYFGSAARAANGGNAALTAAPIFQGASNNTGTGGIGTTSFDEAFATMGVQTSPEGRELNIVPTHALAPMAKRGTLLQYLNEGGYYAAKEAGTDGPNIYAGTIIPIVEARLDKASTNEFYLMSNQGIEAPLRYGHLTGNPPVEFYTEESRDPDGTKILVRSDFYASVTDFRPWYRSSGV